MKKAIEFIVSAAILALAIPVVASAGDTLYFRCTDYETGEKIKADRFEIINLGTGKSLNIYEDFVLKKDIDYLSTLKESEMGFHKPLFEAVYIDVDNRLIIRKSFGKPESVQIQVFDALGRAVFAGSRELAPGANEIRIFERSPAPGAYYSRISGDRGTDVRSFLLTANGSANIDHDYVKELIATPNPDRKVESSGWLFIAHKEGLLPDTSNKYHDKLNVMEFLLRKEALFNITSGYFRIDSIQMVVKYHNESGDMYNENKLDTTYIDTIFYSIEEVLDVKPWYFYYLFERYCYDIYNTGPIIRFCHADGSYDEEGSYVYKSLEITKAQITLDTAAGKLRNVEIDFKHNSTARASDSFSNSNKGYQFMMDEIDITTISPEKYAAVITIPSGIFDFNYAHSYNANHNIEQSSSTEELLDYRFVEGVSKITIELNR